MIIPPLEFRMTTKKVWCPFKGVLKSGSLFINQLQWWRTEYKRGMVRGKDDPVTVCITKFHLGFGKASYHGRE